MKSWITCHNPADGERREKHQQVNREPRLHRRHREMRPAQQIFVIERTRRPQQRSGNEEAHSFIAMKMHAFPAADH